MAGTRQVVRAIITRLRAPSPAARPPPPAAPQTSLAPSTRSSLDLVPVTQSSSAAPIASATAATTVALSRAPSPSDPSTNQPISAPTTRPPSPQIPDSALQKLTYDDLVWAIQHETQAEKIQKEVIEEAVENFFEERPRTDVSEEARRRLEEEREWFWYCFEEGEGRGGYGRGGGDEGSGQGSGRKGT